VLTPQPTSGIETIFEINIGIVYQKQLLVLIAVPPPLEKFEN